MDVFERLGQNSGTVHNSQSRKASVFQRLGPRVCDSQPQKAMGVGPVSGRDLNSQSKKSVFHRLGSDSGRVQSSRPKMSVFQRLGPGPVMDADDRPRKLVDYDWVLDGQPQKVAVVEKNQEIEEVCKSEEKCKILDPSCFSPVAQPLMEKKQEIEEVCKSEEKCEILDLPISPCFSLVAQLEGHQSAITGFAFPYGFDKLYTGSEDHNVRVWDCKSGKCVGAIDIGGAVGCLVSEGPWIFVGSRHSIKVWNTETNAQFTLDGLFGQVYAIAVAGDRLFAGAQDGNIYSWRFDVATNSFQPATSLTGHTSVVVSLAVGPNKLLYSGSVDSTVQVWNVETSERMQILIGHSSSVTSVIAVQQNIISCSLDGTFKIWAASAKNGMWQVIYTHTEKCGLLKLCGVNDLEAKPVLLCSCNDNTVRAYDLQSFAERGRIDSKEGVQSIQLGLAGMFFTGDGAGQVKVWKWSEATSRRNSRCNDI